MSIGARVNLFCMAYVIFMALAMRLARIRCVHLAFSHCNIKAYTSVIETRATRVMLRRPGLLRMKEQVHDTYNYRE